MSVERGLEGVVMGQSRLSRVDGEQGRLTIAGYELEDLAPRSTFEQVVFLLRHDRMPSEAEHERLRESLASVRALGPTTLTVLREGVKRGASPMTLLSLGIASVGLQDASPDRIIATVATLAAACHRLGEGLDVIEPDPGLDHAENLLYMLSGEPPRADRARALHTYLVTTADHGMNASTFTARVIASTGAQLSACIEGALGALSGPLHGGAPGPALQALLTLRSGSNDLDGATRAWARDEVSANRRIMGFGHRVYRVRDPRADVLGAAARTLLEGTGLYEDAAVHERAVLQTLRELKPGRALETNVEFYTALLLHGLGLCSSMFTPTFAVGRVAGWTAHVAEQVREGRLLRPRVAYCGAEGRRLEAARAHRT